MEFVQAADALQLAELTPCQLREWCVRRGIVPPDVPPHGPGRHALYSWRTILTLRIAKELIGRFAIELGEWKGALQACRAEVGSRSFPALWGALVAFPDSRRAQLLTNAQLDRTSSVLVVSLDTHLEVIARGLEMPSQAQQYQMFPASVVSGRSK